MARGEHDRRSAGPTPQEKVREALTTLEQGIDSILTSDGFATYLRTMARFHTYSAGNVALILAQNSAATRVAGYRRWQELGRQVKKGERGIAILVPYKRRVPREEEDDEATMAVSGFGIGHVWDIAQTTGDPIAEPPAVQMIDGASDVGMRLFVDLVDFSDLRGVSYGREHLPSAYGSYDPLRRRITVAHDLDGDQATKTLAHETAHMVAGHTLKDNSREVETVAESSAFVVLNHYDIDSGGYSFPYVSRWAQDRAVLKRNLEAIQQVSHEIIGTLEGEREHVVFERPAGCYRDTESTKLSGSRTPGCGPL